MSKRRKKGMTSVSYLLKKEKPDQGEKGKWQFCLKMNFARTSPEEESRIRKEG